MTDARNHFRALVKKGGAQFTAMRTKGMFAHDYFATAAPTSFTIDDETERLSSELNAAFAEIRRRARGFYGLPAFADMDVYVGVVKDASLTAFVQHPQPGSALIVWTDGFTTAFRLLARFLEQLTRLIGNPAILHSPVFRHCWSEMVRVEENPNQSLTFPELFAPFQEVEGDSPRWTYDEPSAGTFYEAIVNFVLGHELGHIVLEYFNRGDGDPKVDSFRAAVASAGLVEADRSLCEEIVCDEVGLFTCIAACCERWGGRLKDDGFDFEDHPVSRTADAARRRYHFEAFLADSMSALCSLFNYQEARECLLGVTPDSHPSAGERSEALFASNAGQLLSAESSLLTHAVAAYGRRFNRDLGFARGSRAQGDGKVTHGVDVYRRALEEYRPVLRQPHWGTHPKRVATTDGDVVWFPGAYGGIDKGSDLPRGSIVGGLTFEGGNVRPMAEHELLGFTSMDVDVAKSANNYQAIADLADRLTQGDDALVSKTIREAEYHYNRAIALSSEGKTEAAITELTLAVRICPSLHSAYFNRANAYMKLKRYQAAICDYKRTVALDPTHYKAYCNCGICLWQVGVADQAIRYLKRSAELGDEKAQAILTQIAK